MEKKRLRWPTVNEQLLEERQRLMGAELGLYFHHVEQQSDSLSIKWCEFATLFADGAEAEDRARLLNAVAPTFFYLVKQMFWENAILHLCRLTDPAWQGRNKYENLSLERLLELIPESAFKAALTPHVLSAVKKCEFARFWRDKWLAHGSAELLTERTPISSLELPLPEQAVDAIAAIRNVIELVARHYKVGCVSSLPRPNPWGSKALVLRLEKLG